MSTEFIFDRRHELAALCERLQERRTGLLHGPAGVGKTFLLTRVLREFPDALYCADSPTVPAVLRELATALFQRGSPRLRAACGRQGRAAISAKSAISLKGIVLDALREERLFLVLDHLARPSASYAAKVREIVQWAPVMAVARSPHMEDTGALHALFADRQDRFELRNFEPATAEQFAREAVNRAALQAGNLEEFLARVLELSHGNPGAILAMIAMARQPRYRSADHIKVTGLYIDFRMNWGQAAAGK